jgi:hypothetical protein
MKTKVFQLIVSAILLVVASGYFRTGCVKNAEAANVMLTKTYSFTIIKDITVTEVVPPDGATGVARSQIISISFTHTLPIVSATISVKADGVAWAGTQVMTTITGGKKIVWTPTNPFPIQSGITWQLDVTVDNGL